MNQTQILYEYIESLKLQGKSIRNPKTAIKVFFKYLLDNDLNYARVRLQQAQEFQTYLVTKTDNKGRIHYSKRSVGTMIGSITAFYDWLTRRKVIYGNPFMEIKKLRSPKVLPKNILDESKTSILLKSLREFQKGKNIFEKKNLYKAHVISELMYSTGARINEIAKLKKEDIDFVRGVVTITDSKSKRIREAILNEYASKVLHIFCNDMREYINFGKNNADNTLLFGTKSNLQSWLNAILNRTSERQKFGRYSSHNFRHSVGAHLLRNGCDIRYIQEILGHKDLSSTQVYTQIEKEDLRNVIDKYHPRKFMRLKSDEK